VNITLIAQVYQNACIYLINSVIQLLCFSRIVILLKLLLFSSSSPHNYKFIIFFSFQTRNTLFHDNEG